MEELRDCLAEEWKTESRVFIDTMIAVRHDWVFFANDGPDSYIRLLLNDEIPVETIPPAELPEIQGDHVIQPFGHVVSPYIELGQHEYLGSIGAIVLTNICRFMIKKLKEARFRVKVK